MRKAREFLGISKRSRTKIPLEQICPPFSKPHSTNTMDLSPSLYDKERGIQRGKERIRTNDVDAMVGYFESRGFSKQSSISTATVLLTQAKIDGINAFTLIKNS